MILNGGERGIAAGSNIIEEGGVKVKISKLVGYRSCRGRETHALDASDETGGVKEFDFGTGPVETLGPKADKVRFRAI